MKKSFVFVLVSALFTGVGVAQADGDVAAGQAASAACVGCHGVGGLSVVPTFPRLAGQHSTYIEKQLRNFKSKERDNPIMFGMAAGLDDMAIKNLAAYFSSQPAAAGTPGDAALIAKGKAIYKGGVADRHIAACASCHGPDGKGLVPLFPSLTGQHSMYLVGQLQSFKSGQRNNDPAKMMQGVVKAMTASEMDAVAAYLQSL